MVTVYDPFAAFFGLAFFMAFFGILFGAVLFPWLPFVMLDSMGDWWRSRGERELQRAQAERERAAACGEGTLRQIPLAHARGTVPACVPFLCVSI